MKPNSEAPQPIRRRDLPTPALIIDLAAFERNVAIMAEWSRGNGIKIRPHAKTHKSGEIARRQLAAGAVGIWLHYAGNVEFEREMEPTMRGLHLFWQAMKGATPALAPGSLAHLGLFGLACTWRHPALRQRAIRPGAPGATPSLQETR